MKISNDYWYNYSQVDGKKDPHRASALRPSGLFLFDGRPVSRAILDKDLKKDDIEAISMYSSLNSPTKPSFIETNFKPADDINNLIRTNPHTNPSDALIQSRLRYLSSSQSKRENYPSSSQSKIILKGTQNSFTQNGVILDDRCYSAHMIKHLYHDDQFVSVPVDDNAYAILYNEKNELLDIPLDTIIPNRGVVPSNFKQSSSLLSLPSSSKQMKPTENKTYTNHKKGNGLIQRKIVEMKKKNLSETIKNSSRLHFPQYHKINNLKLTWSSKINPDKDL